MNIPGISLSWAFSWALSQRCRYWFRNCSVSVTVCRLFLRSSSWRACICLGCLSGSAAWRWRAGRCGSVHGLFPWPCAWLRRLSIGRSGAAIRPLTRSAGDFRSAPWIYAWLTGLAMAGLVLGIGHFTRYKPGPYLGLQPAAVGIAFGVFHRHIGFAELDYQRDVANNNPEDAVEFHDNDVSSTIDSIIQDDALRSFLVGKFIRPNRSCCGKSSKPKFRTCWPTTAGRNGLVSKAHA